MANVVYMADISDRCGFYIGAGAGIVWSATEIDSINGIGIGAEFDDEWNFAAQAKAGVSFHLNESTSLNVGYRFFYGRDAVGGQDDAIGHIAEAGVTFRF